MQKIIEKVNWIPIANDTVHKGVIRIIDKRAFATLSYLLIICHDEDYAITTIKTIQQIMKIKENRTIRKILKTLEDVKYINFDKEVDILKYKYTDVLKINILYKKYALENNNGFEMIPTDLFKKYIYNIDHNGWSLLCTLAIYNNYNDRCAYPSYSTLQDNLKMSAETLNKTILLLCKNKLLELVNKNKKIYTYEDENGNILYRFTNNKYYVTYMYEDELWVNYINQLHRNKNNNIN